MLLTCAVLSSFIAVGKCFHSAFADYVFSPVSSLLIFKGVCFAVYFKHVLLCKDLLVVHYCCWESECRLCSLALFSGNMQCSYMAAC